MVYLKYILLTIAASLTLMVSTNISNQSVTKTSNRMNYVAYAITEIIKNLSDKHLKKIDVAVYGYNKQLQFLAQKLIKNLANGKNLVKLRQRSHDQKMSPESGQTPRIILASQEIKMYPHRFKQEERRQFYANHDVVMIFYYLNESNMTVYTRTLDTLDFIDIKPRALFIGHATDRNSNNLKLYGFVKYSTCTNDFALSLRNTFNASTMKWTNQTFQHDYKNFNGCPLIVYVIEFIECALKIERGANDEVVGLGYIYGRLINLYAEKHDATVHAKSQFSDASEAVKVDIVILPSTKIETIRDSKYEFTPTVAIDDHKIALLVTLGREFTPFEKLILPFDSMTWYLNLLTVLVGYLVILILNQMPTNVQKFVFGTYNRNPSMALSQIFFGIGLVQTPGRNFARFIFMMFTVFCLIIRTAYQSKMYDFLQYDERQPTLKTIQEVLQNNVSMSPFLVYLSDELKKDLGIVLVEFKLEDMDRLCAGEGGQHAYVIDRSLSTCYKFEDAVSYKSLFKNMRETDDDLVTGFNTWYIHRNSVVHKSLSKFLLECHQHGIISYMKKTIRGKIQDMYVPEEETKVLTMYMLSAGFYVWLASIGIACVVFVLEHIHKRVTQK